MMATHNMYRYKQKDIEIANIFRNEDRAKAKNVFVNRSLQNDLDRERGIERMHMDTIRREQVMLQKELQKVRTKGQYLNGNRPIVRSQNRLRHARYTHERPRPKDGDENAETDEIINSAFPSIQNKFTSKSTPLQREYEHKMQVIHKESTREQTLSQRRISQMSRKQEKLVARVADLTEGLKQTTTTEKRNSIYKGITNDGNIERRMSHQEKVTNNLKTLPSIFSLPIPTKFSLPESQRRDLSPLSDVSSSEDSLVPLPNGSEPFNNKKNLASLEDTTSKNYGSTRVAGMMVNPTLFFDQDKYAPDGGLRTLHMLPDSEDVFHEAKKARYLRWKDPQKIDKELSVSEVFPDSKKKTRRQSKLIGLNKV